MPHISKIGYVLKKNEISKKDLFRIQNELYVRPQSDSYIPKYKVYRENDTHIILPRYYGIENIGNAESIIPSGIYLSDKVTFDGNLREATNQPEASKAMLKQLKSTGGGILSLPTGYGKTTVALHILANLGVRTIIFVHKEFLMNQWIDKIKEFIPNANIGRIQGNITDVIGKDIVVAMLQSVCVKDYSSNIFEGFGFMIIDETHHICTRVFSNVFFKINTKYMLGLSATVERKDGLTKVIEWFIGNVAFKILRSNQSNVKVKKVNYKSDIYKNDFPLMKTGKLCIVEAITTIININDRNDVIVNLICQNKHRNVLVLTDRREHCFEIENRLKKIGQPVGLYIGGLNYKDLKESENCNIIIGTYSLVNEGLDIPKLDTLIMATPKVDVIQSVGRILRETTGKQNNPLIIDIVDNWGCFPQQFIKRKKYYNEAGFDISKENENKNMGYMFDKLR